MRQESTGVGERLARKRIGFLADQGIRRDACLLALGGGWYETDFKSGKKKNVVQPDSRSKSGDNKAAKKKDSGSKSSSGKTKKTG